MKKLGLFIVSLMLVNAVHADMLIEMYSVEKEGEKIGTVRVQDSIYGLMFYPHLHHLSPGIHGFHIHDLPFCGHNGTVTDGHLDPLHTKQHKGPYEGGGHLGDLPVLIVDERGRADLPVLAPRLKLDTIKEHSLVIHSGGDNYSDYPQKTGGGGAMFACGEIPYPH